MNKEEIYDVEIAPLMATIIAICQDKGIAMVASFALPTKKDTGLHCTTHLFDGQGVPDPLYMAALELIYHTPEKPKNETH